VEGTEDVVGEPFMAERATIGATFDGADGGNSRNGFISVLLR
jgi:hypothetical protein